MGEMSKFIYIYYKYIYILYIIYIYNIYIYIYMYMIYIIYNSNLNFTKKVISKICDILKLVTNRTPIPMTVTGLEPTTF